MTPEEPESHDRLPGLIGQQTERLSQQWAALRAVRRPDPLPIESGPTNFTRAQVPWGVDVAAAWSWRFIVIVIAVGIIAKALSFLSVIMLPIAVSLLLAALIGPGVERVVRIGVPRGLAAGVAVIGSLALVIALLTFAGQQVASGANDLVKSVAAGIGEIKVWLRDGPLNASDSQINDYLDQIQKALTDRGKDPEVVSRITTGVTAIGHVLAGFFIVLFATFFFLADGSRIWAWFVRLAPRAARDRVDSSGRVAWVSLTQFVRATVIVALVDAVGIMIVAWILKVPFVAAIGVLVFLGAFVPMIGATIAGTVAVLVALVDRGPVVALLMLGGVILVQQIEGHVLQPFLMGRWVSVHPLGVIMAIGAGVLVAGIAGALIAVPLAAAANAVVQHLASHTAVGDDSTDHIHKEVDPPPEPGELPPEPEDKA